MSDRSEKGGLEKAIDLAVMAKRLASIAKAAAVAGLKGAAFQTAKEFAPQLMKVAVVVLMVLILLPYLIISALPNILFKYDAQSDDVKAMTDKAFTVENAYASAVNFDSEELDNIINGLSEGYDEVEIKNDSERLNQYWYIAICSVAYEQDLFVMDEDDIRSGTIAGVNLYNITTTEETYELADAGQVETLTKLKVDVNNFNHEELMEQLNFSEEQKNWARTIYNTIADNQKVSPGDPGYIDGTLTNYGDITYRQGATNVIYYNQGDARWGHLMYGLVDTIKDCGCGPTSLAMVVSTFTDTIVEPKEMADWSYEHGYCAPNAGSYHSLIPAAARAFGLQVEGATRFEGQKIVDALADGKLVIAIMGKGHFTVQGHFMVLRGVTEGGKILVADPGSIRNTGIEWDLNIILNESRRGAGAGGPFWILEL